MQPALRVARHYDFERPAVEREHEGLFRLHLGRAPRELPRLWVPVRPRRARELPLASAAEVGKFAEVLEVVGQLLVDGGDGGTAEILSPRAVVGEERVFE